MKFSLSSEFRRDLFSCVFTAALGFFFCLIYELIKLVI